MEGIQILDLIGGLKLYGMRGAYDEIMVTATSASKSHLGTLTNLRRPWQVGRLQLTFTAGSIMDRRIAR